MHEANIFAKISVPNTFNSHLTKCGGVNDEYLKEMLKSTGPWAWVVLVSLPITLKAHHAGHTQWHPTTHENTHNSQWTNKAHNQNTAIIIGRNPFDSQNGLKNPNPTKQSYCNVWFVWHWLQSNIQQNRGDSQTWWNHYPPSVEGSKKLTVVLTTLFCCTPHLTRQTKTNNVNAIHWYHCQQHTIAKT